MSNKKELQVKMSSKFPTKKVFITTLSGLAIATALSTGAIQAEASSASNPSPVPTSVEKEREKAALVRRGVIEEEVKHSDDSQSEDVSEPQEPVEQPVEDTDHESPVVQPVEEVKEEPETQPEEVEQSTPVQKPVEQPTERVQDVVSNIGLQLPLKNANDVRGLATVGNIRYPWTANSVESIREEINRQSTQESRPENISEEFFAHKWYRIQWGDTVNTIASAYGIDADTFVEMNQIDNRDLIYSGDWVILNVGESVVTGSESGANDEPEIPTRNDDITRFNTQQDNGPEHQPDLSEKRPVVDINNETDGDSIQSVRPSPSNDGTGQLEVNHTGGDTLNEERNETSRETKEEAGEIQEEVSENETETKEVGAGTESEEDEADSEGTKEEVEPTTDEEDNDLEEDGDEIPSDDDSDQNDDNEPSQEDTDEEDIYDVTIEKNEVVTPHEIVEIETDELFIGEREVISEGIDGYSVEEIEITTNLLDGTREERVLKASSNAPVNAVVLVGTKEIFEVTYEEVVTEETTFETEYVGDTELYEDEEVVLVEGKDGVLTITYKVTTNLKDGTETREEISQHDSAINEVIARGTKELYETSYETEETKSTPFEIQYIEDHDLYEDEEVVVVEGRNGSLTTTYLVTTNLRDGSETRVQVAQASSTPQNQIVARGTKSLYKQTRESEETSRTPFEVRYIEDHDLYEDEEVVVTEGKEGVLTTNYIVTTNLRDGSQTREQYGQASSAPQDRVIARGTKQLYDIEYETEITSRTPYGIDYIEDANLFEDEEVIVEEGTDGTVSTTYEIRTNLRDGTVTREQYAQASNTPLNQVIARGTKQLYNIERVTEETSRTPFGIEYIESDKYFIDEEVVVHEGIDGVATTTYEIRTNLRDGTVTKELYGRASNAPINRVIARGTKDIYRTYEETIVVTTPAGVKYIESDQHYIGEEVVIFEGLDGSESTTYHVVENLKEGTEVRTVLYQSSNAPSEKIIAVGTKALD